MNKSSTLVYQQDNRVVINGVFRVTKLRQGSFILSDVKKNKETGAMFYPTIAVYSNEIKLIADIINCVIKRGVFLKTITTYAEMMRESRLTAELCRTALSQFNKNEEPR